ncbi:alpha/beta hydrolase [Pontimicrobium aquaticum]|uniref:Alpha/beta hydrolase n=1 Tax=Pontimicrobium aquaticum TaxID=2565367 RepID=A0A4U0EUP3_9FLAO|nr:alpha/beta hydrolase [Pontimicrobium aquaticum]TJY34132.1 alpha/beta hydrolase [Pontimicrobium aquaticum]
MNQELIHVYFMPGMAANPSIFEFIKLPEDKFMIHLLEWVIPQPNETLVTYAKRMSSKIEYDDVVLLGVSFGGVLVQEMSKFLKLKKLIIVSSVKTKHELPIKMKLAKATKAYKLLPTQFVGNFDSFAKYAFGETIKKRVKLYKKYLSVNDKRYLDWAIHNMMCWEQEEVIPGIIHIHGDKDPVFPIKHITNCITVKGGTHVMIINKYKWFNTHLPELILS